MKIALVTLTSLVFAASAFAADSGEDHRAKFKELDTDSSMTLSQEELEAAGDSQKFSQYDLDGNGEVTQEEFLSVKGAKDRRDRGETSRDTGWGSGSDTGTGTGQ
ncbi:MAG: hypothetical protein M0Q49_01320 [Porticoccaceae bacterium]|nr:hypothetical protein [Porticoccaceae bacterium]